MTNLSQHKISTVREVSLEIYGSRLENSELRMENGEEGGQRTPKRKNTGAQFGD